MSNTMLEVANLHKFFDHVHAVKDLSFSVKRGEIFGFLGPNGAGKTTTMRILTGYLPASDGFFKIAGLDSGQARLEIQKKIGYLPETTPLYGEMFVHEYLTYAGKIRGMKRADLSKALDKMLTICGLRHMRNRPVSHLSKGYRQRVGLAQAMLHEPELLILDEPMSGLDPNQIVEIRQLIKDIGQEKTVIYCSHILSEVSQTCDRIMIVKEGQKISEGTPEELTANREGRYSYETTLKGDVKSGEKVVRALPGSDDLRITESKERVTIRFTSPEVKEVMGETLYDATAENNLKIIEFYQKQLTLEEVFTQLTREEA